MFEFHRYIGLTGVLSNEPLVVRQAANVFSFCHIPIVIWLALQWHLELLGSLSSLEIRLANFAIWFFFLTQVTTLSLLSRHRGYYLLRNWMYLVILVVGLPFVFNFQPLVDILDNFRLLLVIILLVPWVDACYRSLSDNSLGTTLLTAFVITLLAGIIIAGLDPNIRSFTDGIWWAWVTVTTVGYGDVVPVSGYGRVFGALLILMGLGLFSVLIANFSALFVQKEVIKVKKESLYIRKILEDIQKVKEEEEDILLVIKDIRQRLSRLEQKLGSEPPNK